MPFGSYHLKNQNIINVFLDFLLWRAFRNWKYPVETYLFVFSIYLIWTSGIGRHLLYTNFWLLKWWFFSSRMQLCSLHWWLFTLVVMIQWDLIHLDWVLMYLFQSTLRTWEKLQLISRYFILLQEWPFLLFSSRLVSIFI